MLQEALQGDCVFLDEADLQKLLMVEGTQLLASDFLQCLKLDTAQSKVLGTPIGPTLYLLFSPLQWVYIWENKRERNDDVVHILCRKKERERERERGREREGEREGEREKERERESKSKPSQRGDR